MKDKTQKKEHQMGTLRLNICNLGTSEREFIEEAGHLGGGIIE